MFFTQEVTGLVPSVDPKRRVADIPWMLFSLSILTAGVDLPVPHAVEPVAKVSQCWQWLKEQVKSPHCRDHVGDWLEALPPSVRITRSAYDNCIWEGIGELGDELPTVSNGRSSTSCTNHGSWVVCDANVAGTNVTKL
jgi:hypothetical protein